MIYTLRDALENYVKALYDVQEVLDMLALNLSNADESKVIADLSGGFHTKAINAEYALLIKSKWLDHVVFPNGLTEA